MVGQQTHNYGVDKMVLASRVLTDGSCFTGLDRMDRISLPVGRCFVSILFPPKRRNKHQKHQAHNGKASLRHNHYYVSIMLLIPECSPGVFRKIWLKAKPELMKEWNLYGNNVTSLKKKCRNVIRNRLSPRADLKIKKLPLPTCLIKFLRIPELDNID